ncbi:MAG: sel1 repeat family protein [Selenomonadaceae bacterium]|nr:sel1 repeat family protein [Selenomonadaceae bacterium]
MKKIIALILTMLFMMSLGVEAKTAEEKAAAKEEKQIKKQMKKLAKAYKIENAAKVAEWAEGGDVQAQCILSYAYTTGQRFKKDRIVALNWQNKAAEQNIELVSNFIPKEYGDKKIDLSKLFGLAAYRSHDGKFVDQNFDEAVKWADLGAKELNEQSLAYLGSAYYTGRGMIQDYKKAISYLKLAGEEPLALELLSDAYAKGNGVDQNADLSKFYYSYLRLVRNPKLHKEELKILRKNRKKIESGELTGIVRK